MRIYTDVEQGSGDWYRLRLGIPTASSFDKIVTPKKCELSKSAVGYALKLCSERLLNTPGESFEGIAWMERGKELEPTAVKQYEFTHDVKTFPVGFITTDDGLIGCSPDRLVLSDKKIGLEVKCPSPHVHLGYQLAAAGYIPETLGVMNAIGDEYKPQVQGQIYVAELDRADLYSYHPSMPPARIETARDAAYIAKLSEALKVFCGTLADMMTRARELGVYQAMAVAKSPAEIYESQELERILRGEAVETHMGAG